MRLHQLLIDSASSHPDNLAVAAPDGDFSYAELNRLADRYAAALTARGLRPGDRVVLWGHKSGRIVAAMQGCLRVGAIYIPVTRANPPSRLAKITADAGADLILADDDLAVRARHDGWLDAPLLTFLELLSSSGDEWPVEPYRNQPDEPAYILYTSGSTGDPKGVCISHRNALAFVTWAVELLELHPGDRLSNHASFNFDLSVFDLYGAFASAASVHLVPAELGYAPRQLLAFMVEHRISVWYSVPSALSLMIRDGCVSDSPPPPALRHCIFAGEPFGVQHLQALRKMWPGVRMFNWYGPTETNVCTSYEVDDSVFGRDRPVPIGRACSGDSVYLDPPGEGEVVVAGPTVMLGYWGREPQRGPYRTGDIARLTDSGDLEYLGRRDNLVKVRGNRVELGELESAIRCHQAVEDVVALLTGSGLQARLHAVVVPHAELRPNLLDIKKCCAERLPAYMIIDDLHLLDQLPYTPNGKVDRSALRSRIEAGQL